MRSLRTGETASLNIENGPITRLGDPTLRDPTLKTTNPPFSKSRPFQTLGRMGKIADTYAQRAARLLLNSAKVSNLVGMGGEDPGPSTLIMQVWKREP